MKHFYLFILFCFFYSGHAPAQEVDGGTYKKEKNKTKNESFLDYFNLKPKANRNFTSIKTFAKHEGLIIREIYIKVFDRHSEPLSKISDLRETEIHSDKKNKFNTRLVSKHLLFELGEKIDPNILSDNERFIREGTIYTDAMITVVPSEGEDGFADVYVFIQDNRHAKIAFEASPSGITMGGQLYDFLGVSQQLSFSGGGLFNIRNPYSFETAYKVNNIARSKIDFQVDYTKQNIVQEARFQLDRKFFAYNTKWAGSLDVKHSSEKISSNPNNLKDIRIEPEYNLKYLKHDYWLARSFAMPKFNERNKTIRLIIASRATFKQHLLKPDSDQFPVQNFVNKSFFLGSIGIATRDWYGVEELYQFRQFDYVPKGLNIALMGGYEINEFLGHRYYSGSTFSYANFFKKFGYLQSEIRYGAFIRNKKYEQATVQMNIDYFTKRYKINKLGFRQFITSSTTLSYNRPETEFFSFNDNVKGLRSNHLFGTKSFIMNFESVFYTPVKWWKSRGNFFLFADLGYVTQNENESIFDNVLHQGYGVGIRFQHLVTTINYMELAFGYYPNAHVVNAPSFGFNITMQPSRLIKERNLYKSAILTDIF